MFARMKQTLQYKFLTAVSEVSFFVGNKFVKNDIIYIQISGVLNTIFNSEARLTEIFLIFSLKIVFESFFLSVETIVIVDNNASA